MNVQIKYHHMPSTTGLSEYIEHKLAAALNRFEFSIRRIVMHVYDINGPRGGVDKKCLALVNLKSGGNIAFEVKDTDPFSAIDKLSDKLKEHVRRELTKRRWKRIGLKNKEEIF